MFQLQEIIRNITWEKSTLSKSKNCERGSENERPADAESTSTVTDNNLHSSNTSRLSVVTKENTARISFYKNTSSDEFGTGSSYNQSTDDQCVPGQLPFYNRVSQSDLVKWGKVNGVDITVSMNVINDAYNEVVYWRETVFLVPYGKIGKYFIDELTLLIKTSFI